MAMEINALTIIAYALALLIPFIITAFINVPLAKKFLDEKRAIRAIGVALFVDAIAITAFIIGYVIDANLLILASTEAARTSRFIIFNVALISTSLISILAIMHHYHSKFWKAFEFSVIYWAMNLILWLFFSSLLTSLIMNW